MYTSDIPENFPILYAIKSEYIESKRLAIKGRLKDSEIRVAENIPCEAIAYIEVPSVKVDIVLSVLEKYKINIKVIGYI